MLIKNCRIVGSKGIRAGDILIDGERVARVGRGLKGYDEVIDAKGGVVMPGVVDAHVHVRDWDESRKEDFTSASRAALSGGVTTFLEMPNTSPEITDLKMLRRRIETGEKKSLVDFGTHMGLPKDMGCSEEMDVPSLKVYMDRLGDDVEKIVDSSFSSGLPLSFHCEDPRIIRRNRGFSVDKGDFLLHSDIREKEAEINAVAIVARIAERHGKKAHLCHLTLGKSIGLLNRFTTSEVTPHHLLLTEKDLRGKKGIAKTNPPLRSKLDVYRLWKAVKEGRVDVIASDHAPHTLEEKQGDVNSCPSGIPNLDVMLKVMLDLVHRGSLKLPDLVRMMCENPARIFQVKRKGFIAPGFDADLLILDLDRETKINPSEFYSKARYSPFEGRKTVGAPKTVVHRGRVAFEEGEFFIGPGHGRHLYKK